MTHKQRSSSKQRPSSDAVVAISDEPHHHLIIDNDVLRAYAVEIGPGERTLCHQHLHHFLMYIAGSGQVRSTPQKGRASEHEYKDSDCEFFDEGLVHVVENLGREPFRNLIVELLPGAGGVQRQGLPFASVAGVQAKHLYSGEKICAQLFELRAGSQTQVTGPAVVAPSNGHALELITPEAGVRKLQYFRDLGYVEPGSTGLLRCEGDSPVAVLVVSVGVA